MNSSKLLIFISTIYFRIYVSIKVNSYYFKNYFIFFESSLLNNFYYYGLIAFPTKQINYFKIKLSLFINFE